MEPKLINHYIDLIEVVEERRVPNMSSPLSFQDRYIVHLVLSGQGEFICDDSIYLLTAGDLFYIEPGVVTAYHPNPGTTWEYTWIGLRGEMIPSLMAYAGFTVDNPVFHCTNPQPVQDTFQRMCDLFHFDGRNNFLVSSIFIRLLDTIYRMRFKKESPTVASNVYMNKATSIVSHQYHLPSLTIYSLAEMLSIDRSYLYKLFINAIGQSPQEYLLHYRLEKARNLLEHSQLSITTIMVAVGFTSMSHFSQIFKKHYKLSPVNYRKTVVINDSFISNKVNKSSTMT